MFNQNCPVIPTARKAPKGGRSTEATIRSITETSSARAEVGYVAGKLLA
jgi:hypothetical protein